MADILTKENSEQGAVPENDFMPKEGEPLDDALVLLENNIKKYNKSADFELLEKAYYFSKAKHAKQKRKSGEPFFVHPVAVAGMLADMEMDMASITAGLLHDIIEDTNTTYETIEEMFGHEIAYLVDGVTKLKKIPTETKEDAQAENLRKMILSMAEDIRVIVIKLIDRLHNMRTLQYLNTDSQMSKARETLEIYTPLAHRLGMTKIKWELEDLCFKYLDPQGYDTLAKQIDTKREQQEAYIANVLATIKAKTDEMNIKTYMDGRPKHLYSIRKKMISQGKTLDQIYDLIAVRVIVDTVKECYTVLGIVHELFTPMPGRVKDYIAMPKPNMYQSLHTTLIGPDGQPFEVQIRTWEMHKIAEIGIAAHWKYKEGGKQDNSLDKKLEWIRHTIESQKEVKDSGEFVETFKMDLFTDEVFVFTPKGEVKNLPAGSTPIDFAYSIHSAIGNRTIGARVNGEIKPLNYKLKNGDIVEIITSSPPGRGPSRDWLNIVKSSEAKNKIRAWFKKERREENIEHGKEMIDREIKKTGLSSADLLKAEYLEPVLKRFNMHTVDDLYNVIGFGELSALKIVTRLLDERKKNEEPDADIEEILKKEPDRERPSSSETGIIVEGIRNCLVRLSHCCNPVPGDMIVGYVTKGRGVSVHRADCPNVAAMDDVENRMIDVRWAEKSKTSYLAEIVVKASDRPALLLDVANVIADENINMKAMNARKTKDAYAVLDLTIEIAERNELDRLIKRLKRIESVIDVSRTIR